MSSSSTVVYTTITYLQGSVGSGTLSQGLRTITWSAGLEPTAAAETIQARATALTAGVLNQSSLALFLLDARLALFLARNILYAKMATEQDDDFAQMLASCKCTPQPKHSAPSPILAKRSHSVKVLLAQGNLAQATASPHLAVRAVQMQPHEHVSLLTKMQCYTLKAP